MLQALLRPAAVFLALSTFAILNSPSSGGELVSQELARRNGVVRAWFSQVDVAPNRNEVENVVLHDDQLVALTTAGVLHTFDAHTGRTLWSSRIGNPDYPSLGPAVSDRHIAVVNGSTLFVFDRFNGREVLSKRVGGGVGGAPSLSGAHVFVPLFSGRMEGYLLDNPDNEPPWYYTSDGRIFQPPVSTSEGIVAWSTDRAHLYVAGPRGARFRFDSSAPVVAGAAIRSPNIYAATLAGYVVSLNEKTGQRQWRYAAGFPVTQAPVEIAGWLFVATEEPALHALDAATGQPRWIAPGVSQFVSANPRRVYGIDGLGGVVALDVQTGALQARAPNEGQNIAVLNDQTDRLYVYSKDGLVQCLHEIGADAPLYHRPEQAPPTGEQPAAQPAETAPVESGEQAAEPDPFTDQPVGGDPFGGNREDEPTEDAGGDPFGGAAEEDEDDPFAGFDDPF